MLPEGRSGAAVPSAYQFDAWTVRKEAKRLVRETVGGSFPPRTRIEQAEWVPF